MSAPVTDQLEKRRKQREARETAARAQRVAARAQTPEAARNLYTGLITGATEPTDNVAGPERTTDAQSDQPRPREQIAAETGAAASGVSATTPAQNGESVGELVRRVQDGTAERMREASATPSRRRPTGTADLPADAAVARVRSSRHPRRRASERARVPATLHHGLRRWPAIVLLVAGIAILVVALNSGGDNIPRRLDASTSKPVLTGPITNPLNATATFGALGQPARRVARTTHPQPTHRRAHHPRRLPAPTHHRGHTSVGHARTIAKAPAATTQSQSSTPSARAASTTASESSAASSQSSPTSASRPAGPTKSGPLGGIGSCVSGCG